MSRHQIIGRLFACSGLVLLAACLALAGARPVAAQRVYSSQELKAEAARLETAARKILTIGLMPALSAHETRGLSGIELAFPMPDRAGEALLNFYASWRADGGTVHLPVQSLKAVEDMALAYAVLYTDGLSFEPLDLYYSIVQNQTPSQFPNGQPPDVLEALGIPADSYKRPGVDTLSLALRNEALAFAIAHELAHILYRHKGTDRITPAQARADEVQSDRFALELLARTGTPPLGAVLFFQAQVYSLPHPGEYPTRDLWDAYLATASTHPLSVDRIRAMADMIGGPLATRRGREAGLWREIGAKLRLVGGGLDDPDLHKCSSRLARTLPVSALKARPARARSLLAERGCT